MSTWRVLGSRRIKQVDWTFDLELLELLEPGRPNQFFGPTWSKAGTQPRASLCKRLGHTMKDAESIKHRGDRVAVILETIGSSGLDDEQGAIRPQQAPDLFKRRLRC